MAVAVLLTQPARAQTTRLDPTYLAHRIYQPAGAQQALQLANGSRVVLTEAPRAGGQPANRLVRYTAAGALDAAFGTTVAPYTWDPILVAEDANGRLLVALTAGLAVAGQPTPAAFTATATATAPVYALLRQPDGHLLVAGAFEELAGQPGRALARLLPSGAADPTFALSPALRPTTPGTYNYLNLLALQPDGKVLAVGEMRFVGSNRSVSFARFSATGAIDGSFRQLVATPFSDPPYALLVQPDGNVLVGLANYFVPGPVPPGPLRPATGLVRLLPDGSLDPAFVLQLTPTGNSYAATSSLARYPDGRLLATVAKYDTVGTPSTTKVVRLLPNGVPDPTFVSRIGDPGLLTLQPNGRVLLTGSYAPPAPFRLTPLLRLLPNGAPDPSLTPTDLPQNAVYSLTIQPDGAIIAAGEFTQAGSYTRHCLARFLDPNVLTVGAPRQGPTFAAYPVPAHQQLHLALDAAARPRQVQLRDALGRPVRTQAVAAPELTLDVAALPPGVYLLEVQYAGGETATRRITKE